MFFGDVAADRADDLFETLFNILALNFSDDNEPFLAINFNRERRDTTRSQVRMTLLRSQLQILRVMIAASDNDQIFLTAGKEQFTVVDKSEVAGAQVRSVIVDVGIERRRRCLGMVPVAECHARTRYPDLTDFVLLASFSRSRINDSYFHFRSSSPAPDPRLTLRRTVRDLDHAVFFECCGLRCEVER